MSEALEEDLAKILLPLEFQHPRQSYRPIQEEAKPLISVCGLCSLDKVARSICNHWTFCKNCQKMGHVKKHCKASGRRPKRNKPILWEWFPLLNRMMALLVPSLS
jgi:hypothetical protein